MFKELKRIFFKIINLRDTTDVAGTISSIKTSTEIRGYNVWILACGAMLASIGLDLNSPAVIIGAMLISPLMSPILGIGLGVGINDRDQLILALENFAIAVGASLAVSFIYFKITPLGDETSEILARTYPTLLDVLIAIFGGIAGIVAGSRKDKTNAIPGVAIATALMPPVCVAGYGLAKMKWEIFGGAFYLFFINSFFIALSTYLILRFLRFPYAEFMDDATQRKAKRWIAVFAILVIAPSSYFMVNLVKDIRSKQNVELFVKDMINTSRHKALDFEYIRTDSINILNLWMSGDYLSEDSLIFLTEKLNTYGLPSTELRMIQDLPPFSKDELENKTKLDVMKEIQPIISRYEQRLDSIGQMFIHQKKDSLVDIALQNEIKILYPDLDKMAISYAVETDFKAYQDSIPLVLTQWNRKVSRIERQKKEAILGNWLQTRMKWDTVKVVRY